VPKNSEIHACNFDNVSSVMQVEVYERKVHADI